uniref:Uncharacterized protein n=1 Tax=Romanomermis culicivorax TaxID=13658 RepID=A0A915L281_ROMCU
MVTSRWRARIKQHRGLQCRKPVCNAESRVQEKTLHSTLLLIMSSHPLKASCPGAEAWDNPSAYLNGKA